MKTPGIQKLLLAIVATLLLAPTIHAQSVGIGEATPNSKLDILSTNTTGNALEVRQNSTTNASSGVWLINNGLGRAVNAMSLNTANNLPVVSITQLGTGATARGLEVDMDAATTAFGATIFQNGSSDALLLNTTGAGWGIYNIVSGAGGAIYNEVSGTGMVGTIQDLTVAGGIGTMAGFQGQSGTGFLVDSIGGNGWGLRANVNTTTPSTAGLVYGAILGGNQYGVGHGALVNHYGTQGRGAEFNIQNASNPDPAIFAVSTGRGDVMVVQNQNNILASAITIGDFAYTGTDPDDHIGLAASATPAAFFGIGLQGNGNFIGMEANGGFYGLYSNGGVYVNGGNLEIAGGNFTASGTKMFSIDHPHDPENKTLRHFSMESDEVLNVYRGIAVLDANGNSTVALPHYFEDINTNYSYQLTPIGSPQQPYVLEEISNNSFKIAGAANTKVSWMVLAERNDKYLRENPELRATEIAKQPDPKTVVDRQKLLDSPLRAGQTVNVMPPRKSYTGSQRIIGHGQDRSPQQIQQEAQRRHQELEKVSEKEVEASPSKE